MTRVQFPVAEFFSSFFSFLFFPRAGGGKRLARHLHINDAGVDSDRLDENRGAPARAALHHEAPGARVCVGCTSQTAGRGKCRRSREAAASAGAARAASQKSSSALVLAMARCREGLMVKHARYAGSKGSVASAGFTSHHAFCSLQYLLYNSSNQNSWRCHLPR